MCKAEHARKRIDSRIFPGTQGGPLMHVIAAKAVSFAEALRPDFKQYQQQILLNAKALAGRALIAKGNRLVSGGTDNHLFLVDLVKQGLTGKALDAALGRADITVNKNAVPNDPQPPFVTSGIRIGSPAATTRGFKEPECRQIAGWICDIIANIEDERLNERIRGEVAELCRRFPVYGL